MVVIQMHNARLVADQSVIRPFIQNVHWYYQILFIFKSKKR